MRGAAAQTLTAAVCCQTLRGEEGEKEQGHGHRDLFVWQVKDTSLIPPSHIYPANKSD